MFLQRTGYFIVIISTLVLKSLAYKKDDTKYLDVDPLYLLSYLAWGVITVIVKVKIINFKLLM